MNKAEALYSFWSSFGLPAYDEQSVPDDAKMPYITYEYIDSTYLDEMQVSASIWNRSNNWNFTSMKTEEISNKLLSMNPIKIDGGYLYLSKGTPFAKHMADGNNYNVKRALLSVGVIFLTN